MSFSEANESKVVPAKQLAANILSIVDQPTYRPMEKVTEWKSIYLSSAITFMSAVQFSLYFTSLWPFIKVLDPSTTESFFGIVISAYSLAQIIASPLLGYWSNCIRQLKSPLIFCAGFMFIGNAMYFLVEIFPSNHRYFLLFARFITGIGASTIGLLKAYASAASVSKDRSRAIAFVTGGMALGTTFGPAFQVLFSWIGYPGWSLTKQFRMTMFNAPALLACFMNILTLVLLCILFEESFAGIADSEVHKKKKSKNCSSVLKTLPNYDKKAAFVCYALRFTQMFIITNIETVGSSFAMMMFAWTPAEVVRFSSLAHAGKGLFAFIVYFVYILFNLGKKVNERLVCLVCLFGLLAFHAFTFSWPFLPNRVAQYDSLAVLANSSQAVGCDYLHYHWCTSLKQVNLFVYYFFYVLIVGIAFPNINVTMNTLFSRIIGPRMQGTQQGLLQMSGGTARMAGPLLVGYLYTQQGPRLVWIVESLVISLMIVLWTLSYYRLVPLVVALSAGPSIARTSSSKQNGKKGLDAEECTIHPNQLEENDAKNFLSAV